MKTMPRRPSGPGSKTKFMGEVIQAFLIVNGLAWMGMVLASPYPRTMGSTASAHVDARTGKPLVLELKGCTVVAGSSAPVASTPHDGRS